MTAAARDTTEKVFAEINGTKQGMFLQGSDKDRPVLLILHGGPGMPDYFLTKKYPTHLDDIFNVCWWEMRGSGLSYVPGMKAPTIEQLISDTIEISKYLCRRFGHEKIYLMGHSGGTFFGIQAVKRAPELFQAYIGVGQMTHQIMSEMLAYDHIIKKYQEMGRTRMVKRLRNAKPGNRMPLPKEYLRLRDKTMHELGIGTTHEMRSVFREIFLEVWTSPFYSFREKRAIWKGKRLSQQAMWDEMFSTDITKLVEVLSVPAYFCSGKFDLTVSRDMSRSYYEKIGAPLKGFYTFERSAHSPMFEEPERMCQIMKEDVLAGKNSLSDP